MVGMQTHYDMDPLFVCDQELNQDRIPSREEHNVFTHSAKKTTAAGAIVAYQSATSKKLLQIETIFRSQRGSRLSPTISTSVLTCSMLPEFSNQGGWS